MFLYQCFVEICKEPKFNTSNIEYNTLPFPCKLLPQFLHIPEKSMTTFLKRARNFNVANNNRRFET
jgi:hypothetical protein